MSQFFCCHQ